MSQSLKILREKSESPRLNRLAMDDNRTMTEHPDQLAEELKAVIDGEVHFDSGYRALYATDASNYRQVPIGVVLPRHAEDVVRTLELASKYGAPVLSRGGGTSLAGECCNVAVVIDFSKYMRQVIHIDPENKLGTVQPGCVLDDLRDAAKSGHGLTFGPDPETHNHCTLGGMLGNDSCGVHSLMSKNNGMGLRVADNTHELEILTYEGARFRVGPTTPEELESIIKAGGPKGDIYRKLKAFRDKYESLIRTKFPKLERRVSGFNLPMLLPENGFNVAAAIVGSEGTCVTILEATLKLVPEPKARTLVIFGYPDIATAGDHNMEVLAFKPTALEGMDHLLFEYVKKKGDQNAALALLPEGKGFLLAEFSGDSKEESDAIARRCMEKLASNPNPPTAKLYDDKQQEEMVWKVREGSLGSTAWVPGLPDTWPGWEDSAVPVEKVGPYLRDLRKLFNKYGHNPSLYGHLGQGCIHCRVGFDLYTVEGLKKYREFMEEATTLVVQYGGSFSGEHGDGQARGEWLPKMFGDEIVQAFREFKLIWDPQWKMNPGKVVDPYGMEENLRIGPDYNPPQPDTHFSYPADRHSFARASLRCVGVGKCRREGGGTMCPSYMVTHEEKDSTRGRARLLFEMMNGEVIEDGWRSQAVHDALDLCLACKGCKGDCPVNVDMATYKAEFLGHYFEGRLRPRHMYAFGWIHIWSRLAAVAPTLMNFCTQTPGLRSIAKLVAGMEQKRRIPPFAPQSFKRWYLGHKPRHPHGPEVVLFADTFNNYYHVETSKAAVEVLEDAGFHVIVPMQDMCCGRPLYDYGFLNMAKRWLEDMLLKLQPHIEAGTPMIVLEPSCWAVFKDELSNMLPNHRDGERLKDLTYTFADFLRKHAPDYKVPELHRKALVHGHCHRKSLDNLNDKEYGELFAEKEIFRKMGLDITEPADGCCGMAGAFGFEAGKHFDVAIKAGERVLLPKVRKEEDDTLIVADGFSCREQISQDTDRHALHTAQVIALALHEGPSGPTHGKPEAAMLKARSKAHLHAAVKTAVAVSALAATGALAAALLYRASKESSSRASRRFQ
jgi:FAD/FMN-containing dehydrogenase/Fe-S oxidoreductase